MFDSIKNTIVNVGKQLKDFFDNKFLKEVPKPAIDANINQIQILKESKIEERSLEVPDYAPNFSLKNQFNENITLSDQLKKGPVIISFYRGKWCPFCNIELRALQKTLESFQSLGATLLAISPQTVEMSEILANEIPISFQSLSDPGNKVAGMFGLSFKVSDDLKNTFSAFGFSLSEFNGHENENHLPIPATYVVGQNFKIVYAFVDADYTKRAEPAEIINVLKKIKEN